ncbi:MAG: hypothetical protein IKZ92_02845 [Muribaculaceae bacterium]|nr:hypothetical protein [Muribaculaceae bacterium]
MKKTFLISVLALLGFSQGFSQEYEYIPFVREGVKWVCSSIELPIDYYTIEHFFTLEFKGDAEINGKTYKAMHKYSGETIDPYNDTIPVYMREEGKVVYAIVPDGKTYEDCYISCFDDSTIAESVKAGREFVLYDFNDPVDFIMSRIGDIGGVMPQTIMLDNKKVKRYVFRNDYMDFCFIEGIGCDGLTQGYPLAYNNNDLELLRLRLSHVIENGKVIYRSERLNLREDSYQPLIREGVQWVNERVVIDHGDTTRCYYTYEMKGIDDRDRTLCHYYEGESLDGEQDSTIAKFFEGMNVYCDNNKALMALYGQGRYMMNWTNALYSFDNYHGSVLSIYHPIMFYNRIQKGDELTLDNFVEVEPVLVDGVKSRRYAYYGDGDEPLCYVVEGIGFDSRDMGDLLTPFTRKPDPDADYQECWGLSHVIKDGKIIYKGMRYHGDQEPETVIGDVDGDGRVTISDVTALIDILLNGSMEFKMGGDLDSDGKVTISDLTTLIDLLLSSAKE